jgi:hypothetical protein
MPRLDRHESPAADRRRGPYETSYDVVRGYDVPPPASRRASDRVPAMVAARREDRDGRGLYG